MKVSSDEEAPLKEHLKSALHPLCEADPELLADYVIALLKNDSSHEELAASLREALTDFLGENTEVSHPSAFHTLFLTPGRFPAAMLRNPFLGWLRIPRLISDGVSHLPSPVQTFVKQLFDDLKTKPWAKKKAKTSTPRTSSASKSAPKSAPRHSSPKPERHSEEGKDGWGTWEAEGGGGGNQAGEQERLERDRSRGEGARRKRERSRSSDEDEGGTRRRGRRSESPEDDRSKRRSGAVSGRLGGNSGGGGGGGGRQGDRDGGRRGDSGRDHGALDRDRYSKNQPTQHGAAARVGGSGGVSGGGSGGGNSSGGVSGGGGQQMGGGGMGGGGQRGGGGMGVGGSGGGVMQGGMNMPMNPMQLMNLFMMVHNPSP